VNPVDWLAWLFGKFFSNQPRLFSVLVTLLVVVVSGLIAYLAAARAKDKWLGEHPVGAVLPVASSSSVAENRKPQALTESLPTTDKVAISVRRHDLREKAGRANVAKQLKLFIEEGRGLQSELVDPRLSDPNANSRVTDWDARVRQFIDQHMGTEYANRFLSDKNIPEETPLASPDSRVKKQLWLAIHSRNFRLSQFLQELKD
jgi:hypothetical protein